MAQWLRYGTAVKVHIGPAVATGGLAAVTTLTASTVTALKYIRHTATVAVTATGRGLTHVADGHYYVSLVSGDLNVLGPFKLYTRASGTVKALPIWKECVVVPAAVFDALVSGGSKLNVGTLTSGSVVWSAAVRTLTSAGAAWSAGTRTLTSGSAVAASVWVASARTLTSVGAAWSAGTRTLTSAGAVWTAVQTELAAVPAAAPQAGQALMFVYMSARNKRITTATGDKIHTSATAVIGTSALSYVSGTQTFTKSKYA